MAKRFIDTKIWDKAWFRKLTPKNKLITVAYGYILFITFSKCLLKKKTKINLGFILK